MGDDGEATLDMLAADLFVQSSNCVSTFGHFHLAMSHGPAQERFLLKLMTDPKYRSVPWDRTHLWSVAEPMVEPGHPEHSMTHWRQIVGEAGGVPDDQLHLLHAHRPDAAGSYERELVEHLEWRERGHDRLDFVILGDDLELLSGMDDPMERLVGIREDHGAVGMTRRMLNASRMVGIIGIGHAGRQLVDCVRDDHGLVGLRPTEGSLRWYLDAYACRCSEEEPM